MKNRRLLALLLVICMVFSNLPVTAFAVKAPADSVVNAEHETEPAATETTVSPDTDSLVVPGSATENRGVKTMRDEDVLVKSEIVESTETVSADGEWKFAEAEAPAVSLLPTEVPECIQELQKAAELFDADETVRAFVVMEAAPLAESYASKPLASASAEKQLIEKQDSVIAAIERSVLQGEKLEVRYQFTYLTNSFTIETEFVNLEKIAKMDGVKSVFVMPVYNAIPTDETASPNTAGAATMTGANKVWEDLGYTGAGMKIAVIDTGLDLDHPSFAADPKTTDSSLTEADIAAVLEDLNVHARKSKVTAGDLYRTAKVPFAFNYCDNNLTADHDSDAQGDHGTHVAGIAAANALESTTVKGMAPDAQIIVMKVFGAAGGAYTDDIVAALEDAMTLGCDVVNASLGSPGGFSSSDSEIDLIYERLASQDIVACISAGNEGTSSYENMWETNLNRTQNPDNATVGQPGTFENVMTIASADNAVVMTSYITVGEDKIYYNDSIEALYGYTDDFRTTHGGMEYEYVIIDGLGETDDFYDAEGNSLVEGKIAVVPRGTLSFGEKVNNAAYAGAVGVVIWNSNDTDDVFSFGMNTETEEGYPWIRSILISYSDGLKMAQAEEKVMTVAEEQGERQDPNGGKMSSFSSWGVSPDLGLEPDLTGIGGSVYSTLDGGTYGLMSGTSMSSPQVAGVTALVMQRLYELYPNVPNGVIRELAEALLMSTADPIMGSDAEASPRQQGAGLVDAYQAVTSDVYLTVGGNKPKAELGANTSGKYTFSFEIHNIGDEAVTYALNGTLNTEAVAGMKLSETEVEYFMAGEDMPLNGTVSFDKNSVTVPAGGKADVLVTVTLADTDKAYFQQYWENGGYVEGFVYLTASDEEGVVTSKLNLPYLGFYGDWTEAPVFDTAYWYDNSFWGIPSADGLPEGDEYYHVIWTTLAGTDWVLGMNPYSGAQADANGNLIYDPAHNVVSPNGDGVMDAFEEIYLSLLRNAKTLTFTYTVGDEIVHRETVLNNRKTMYNSSYGQVIPWIYSWYGDNMYDFAGLESGTEVLLTIDATVDYGTGGNNTIEIPVTVDTEPGQILATQSVQLEDGTDVLAVKASDDVALAAVFLMSTSGTQIYDQKYDVQLEDADDGAYIAYFDVSDLGTEFMLVVCDYAANEAAYKVTYEAEDDNLPVMDTDQLYAYRVYDDYIYSDHMYGWISMNKPASAEENANISVWTDDYLEYAAINAAEYVDGKIFAVDAVYNLVVLNPGLFDRREVTNIGVNVLDMTFDDSTDTMYVLSKQGYYTYLYSMDLLTGELTQLKSYGYYYYGPWTIADDDNGTLYATKYNSANIFTLDVEGGTYAMAAVTDAEGNAIVINDSYGDPLAPSANSQSITYLDGNLYWAYYKFSYYGGAAELITIDTSDWSSYASTYAAMAYDYEDNLVEYYPSTELVGLLSLTETDYEIPESTEAVSVALDAEQIILGLNQSHALSASWLPWNYDLDETQLVWTSDDETVATVENGVVMGISEGTANVTVSYGDLSASCEVIVVNVAGHFEAYNYYTADGYYGYMIDVDMETMDYTLVGDASPIDFLAGDYNGHDGYFYGYDMGGQLYRYDYESGEATALGASLGTYPVDMAYDYSSGMMYALVLDYNTYQNTLYAVNMNNGSLKNMGTGAGLMTLAIDTEGNMYAMDAYGYLNQIFIQDYSDYGMGMYLEAMPLMEEAFGDLYLLASMCWDHNNDVLLWNWCEAATILWIDLNDGNPFYVNLGDPSESGVLELTGMHVVPDEIPELADVAVKSLTAEDMLILSGYEKVPAVTVDPFNATCQNLVLTSADTSVVEVTEAGTLLAIAEGDTTVTASLTDEVSGETFETTFTVTVLESADNMYAHLLTDVATYNAQAWIELFPGNPGVYNDLAYFDYTIFTEEYVDGKIYTYGYDAMDWNANMQYFVLDAETYEIESMTDMGEAFPFVYDMTYDYMTSTMYVLAGAAEDDTQLYVADMESGKLVLLQDVEPLLLAISAAPGGKLYAIENSRQEYDPMTWETVDINAMLWEINPLEGTVELVGDTGLKSNMISSLAYDYDTDAMYWTAFAQESAYISNLAIVNTETGEATSLGTIGMAGAQVGGVYFICDAYPEADNSTLHNLMMSSAKATVMTGDTVELGIIMIPALEDAEVVWTSSDENTATVADGVVTGVAQGSAVITATATYNGVAKSAECVVTVLDEDAGFLTYNSTDAGWALINRHDYTVVTNLTENQEETAVAAIASVCEKVYGYDVDGQLFQLNTDTYERTSIGDAIVAEEDTQVVVKDMAYDTANGQMLVLIDTLIWDPDWEEFSEAYEGCALYSVDLTTGALEKLYTFADHNYVYAMSVNDEGEVYFYNTFNDDLNVLDLETQEVKKIVSLQTQSLYGDMYCDYSMHYDVMTDTIYMLFTSNGNFYKMVTVDSVGTLIDNGYVGEVVMDGWYYMGDMVRGLAFPQHSWIAATCTEPKTCSVCGETEGEALGHDYDEGICTRCGAEDPDYTGVPESLFRIAGTSRYDTAIAIAEELRANTEDGKFDAVIVANGANYPDALSGSYLAVQTGAPILLYSDLKADLVLDYISENLKQGGTVYVLGGEVAIAASFVEAVPEGFEVKRLAGQTRVDTNLAILTEAGVDADQEILVCTADAYADALSAAATGLPILLVRSTLTDAQKAFLEGHTGKITIIGGELAVNAEIAEELNAERIAGASRFETSIAIAEHYFPEAKSAVLAYSHNFPDGLCGGALAAKWGAPLILVNNQNYALADQFVENMEGGFILGGTLNISDEVAREIFDLDSDAVIIEK